MSDIEQTLIQGESIAEFAKLAPPDPDPLPPVTRAQIVWDGEAYSEVTLTEVIDLVRRLSGELH